jgi:hypothetical protein
MVVRDLGETLEIIRLSWRSKIAKRFVESGIRRMNFQKRPIDMQAAWIVPEAPGRIEQRCLARIVSDPN